MYFASVSRVFVAAITPPPSMQLGFTFCAPWPPASPASGVLRLVVSWKWSDARKFKLAATPHMASPTERVCVCMKLRIRHVAPHFDYFITMFNQIIACLPLQPSLSAAEASSSVNRTFPSRPSLTLTFSTATAII